MRTFAIGVAGLLVALMTLTSGSASAENPTWGVQLTVIDGGTCLEIAGGTQDGVRARAHTCQSPAFTNQQWVFEYKGGQRYWIRPVHSHKCLEVADRRHDLGAPIQQFFCHDGGHMEWIPQSSTGRMTLAPAHSPGNCLSINYYDEAVLAPCWSAPYPDYRQLLAVKFI